MRSVLHHHAIKSGYTATNLCTFLPAVGGVIIYTAILQHNVKLAWFTVRTDALRARSHADLFSPPLTPPLCRLPSVDSCSRRLGGATTLLLTPILSSLIYKGGVSKGCREQGLEISVGRSQAMGQGNRQGWRLSSRTVKVDRHIRFRDNK